MASRWSVPIFLVPTLIPTVGLSTQVFDFRSGLGIGFLTFDWSQVTRIWSPSPQPATMHPTANQIQP